MMALMALMPAWTRRTRCAHCCGWALALLGQLPGCWVLAAPRRLLLGPGLTTSWLLMRR
jgi:hypothetical protein